MNNHILSDLVNQHTDEITILTRKVNQIEADLKIVIRNQSKLSQLIESQIKTNFEITHIKDALKTTNTTITTINTTLKNIETNLLLKEATESAKSNIKADLKKYLPALLTLCAAMFIFGLIIDDMKVLHTIFGR